jgi:hypothetical protein
MRTALHENFLSPGINVMFYETNNWPKKPAILTQITAICAEKIEHEIGFHEHRQ